ncbi:maleylacetate reductase [Sporosarcina sp. ACRSM]|uniref:maleylacetate reductase n=1 Tax=Sporosarcina sp. ACRSM TaxID=2918216 RepID=UPI001EF7355A|nr:maleylacetate reductase [Sporosarcina sp. ACRSM]MCG7335224.1 maleylacetate reductase [Sporosarcina sp. ACRSM]
MKPFLFEILSGRTLFGEGSLEEIGKETEKLNGSRTLIISTPRQKELNERISDLLGKRCAGIYTDVIQHVPIETVEKAMETVNELEIDSLVAVGGGSTVGLAKAIALQKPIPIIAIPTTYSGSEMTSVWGITENGYKTTGKNPNVKPQTVIYDPLLTTSLPTYLTIVSGVNALAHCVEALYAKNSNPITSIMAQEGIQSLYNGLPKVVANPREISSRSEVLYGAWLSGTVLGSVEMALHHKLCHVLGGSYKLPHAETHTVILPYVIAYNAKYAPSAVQAISKSIGIDRDDVAGTLFDLIKSFGVKTSLAEIGMRENDLDEAAEFVIRNPYYNPRPVDQKSIRILLENAYTGARPGIELKI